MALTDDTELDGLFADWIAKTGLAKIAADALDSATDDVATARQDYQAAAVLGRVAATALYNRVFAGPAAGDQQIADWTLVGSSDARDAIDPQNLADRTFAAIVQAALEAGVTLP